jgi:hypothetical protein
MTALVDKKTSLVLKEPLPMFDQQGPGEKGPEGLAHSSGLCEFLVSRSTLCWPLERVPQLRDRFGFSAATRTATQSGTGFQSCH